MVEGKPLVDGVRYNGFIHPLYHHRGSWSATDMLRQSGDMTGGKYAAGRHTAIVQLLHALSGPEHGVLRSVVRGPEVVRHEIGAAPDMNLPF